MTIAGSFDRYRSKRKMRAALGAMLAQRLTVAGHVIAPFDFDIGDKPMDRLIDLPPWGLEVPPNGMPGMGRMPTSRLP